MPAGKPSSIDRQGRRAVIVRPALLLACCIALAAGCSSEKDGGGWKIKDMFAADNDKAGGDEWTILCLEARDPHHVRNCDGLVDALKKVAQLDPSKAGVVHGDDTSRVYYGSYFRKLDKESRRESFGPEMKRDLQLIRSLSGGGSQPFLSARVVIKPTPDPGRAEWQVLKCPGKYTLQIGVFYNTATFAKRKDAAVAWVEQLRKDGVEAYYHHGEIRSSVAVGSFEETDVIRERVGPKFSSDGTRVRYGRRIEAYRQQEQYKYNLENGHKIKRIRKTMEGLKETYQESFLIPVPRPASAYSQDIRAEHRRGSRAGRPDAKAPQGRGDEGSEDREMRPR